MNVKDQLRLTELEYYTSRTRLNDSLIGESAFILASLEIERLG